MQLPFSNIVNFIWSFLLINGISFCHSRMDSLSEFEKEMYKKFNSGNGNLELSNSNFEKIKNFVSYTIKTNEYPNFKIHLNDDSQGKSYIISFYNSPEYDHAFGSATIYVNENNEIVGFLDYYDFDSRPWGERSYTSEIISRSIRLFSPRNAKPFKITYGLQAVSPIYDVVRDKSFSRIS